MVCDFICNAPNNNHFCTRAENLVSLWALFIKLPTDFHSLYILEFHGKVVVTI